MDVPHPTLLDNPVSLDDTPRKKETRASCNSELVSLAAKQYGSHLRTYFYNRLRSHNDVDDLLQELYCRLLTYRHPLRVKSLKSFVFTIALNLLRDKSRRTVTRMASKMTSIEEAEEIPAPATDPTRIIEGIEELTYTGKMIDKLQPACKKAFCLHRIHGLSHKEIALGMGVTVSMVEKHVMSAAKHLRKAAAAA
ncbi:RNA polymerase sigma factor [bacterium AH-315-K03]|nr:RNA polymerase sigma factor [bacterium AH-315-K03]